MMDNIAPQITNMHYMISAMCIVIFNKLRNRLRRTKNE